MKASQVMMLLGQKTKVRNKDLEKERNITFCSREMKNSTERLIKIPTVGIYSYKWNVSKALLLFESLLHMWVQTKFWINVEVRHICKHSSISLLQNKAYIVHHLPSREITLIILILCLILHNSDNRCWKITLPLGKMWENGMNPWRKHLVTSLQIWCLSYPPGWLPMMFTFWH